MGARIPVPHKWNLELLANLLGDYQHRDIVEWLQFVWPVSRHPWLADPVSVGKNHRGAVEFLSAISRYIEKGIRKQHIIGPFNTNPF